MAAGNQQDVTAKATTLAAALSALEPIIALLLDAGINTNEVTRFVRWAFVTEAASRQQRSGKRPSISRIAAATGLTRPEVSQLLECAPPTAGPIELAPRASDKVVAAWLSDPDYLEPAGKPSPLSYSDGESNFSNLAHRYAPDIPPRAMLKEMIASGVVVETPAGTYALSESMTYPSVSQHESLAAFGAKMNGLGWTLLRNLRSPERHGAFETLASVDSINEVVIPKVSRELTRRCRTFAQGIERYLLDQVSDDAPREPDLDEQSIGVIVAVIAKRTDGEPSDNSTGS